MQFSKTAHSAHGPTMANFLGIKNTQSIRKYGIFTFIYIHLPWILH